MASIGALGGRCRALMAAVKSNSASSAKAASASASPAKKAWSGFCLSKVVSVSPQLGDFLGTTEACRIDAIKIIWDYIKLHNLQNPANKREIFCDNKLKTIFDGKDSVVFTEIAKLLSQHFKKASKTKTSKTISSQGDGGGLV